MREELIGNCLHLSHREDRELSIKKEALEQGFYLRFFEGEINRTDRKAGICRGHKRIVADAKENGYPFCLIIEDDAKFNHSADGKLAWDYFLDTMPDDADIYFSMIYVGVINEENRIVSVFSGMTCYIVYQRFYDFFLGLPDSCHIDRELGLHANKFKFIVCDKFCTYQDGSRSDNNFSSCDYSPYLVGRKIYGKD